MRLISLNTWGSRVHEPITEFIRAQKGATDIFCFQEVFYSKATDDERKSVKAVEQFDAFQQIDGILGDDFRGYHAPSLLGNYEAGPVDFHLEYGNASFIRSEKAIAHHDISFVYQDESAATLDMTVGSEPRCVIINRIRHDGKTVTVINFHGLWKPGTNKRDLPERLEQSRRLREIMDRYPGPLIVAGDFNLLPDGQSIALLEKGMRNLVKEYGVTSTRSSMYEKPIKFADYILVSPEIEVNDFKVLPDEVSDHLPLMLDFN